MTTGQMLQGTPVAADPVRIGPFELLSDRQPWETDNAWEAPVRGVEGTPLAGIQGIATGATVAADGEARQRLQARVSQVAKLKHPAITPILAAGVRGDEAVIVYANDGSSPITVAALPPSAVGPMIARIAAALGVAHAAGIAHGAIGSGSVNRTSSGEPRVSRWRFADTDPRQDQHDLAALAVELLAGRTVELPAGQGAQRAQVLRGQLENIAERVVFVLARGLAESPEDRFPTVAELADAFSSAIRFAAEDLASSAWEAMSAGTPELARFFADAATRYDPTVQGLAALRVQLSGGQAPFGGSGSPAQWAAQPLGLAIAPPLGAPTTGGQLPPYMAPAAGAPFMPPQGNVDSPQAGAQAAPPTVEQVMTGHAGPMFGAEPALGGAAFPARAPGAMTGLDPALTAGVPPELLATISPSIPKASKKRTSPLWIIIIGMAGMFLLMAIAAFATIALGG